MLNPKQLKEIGFPGNFIIENSRLKEYIRDAYEGGDLVEKYLSKFVNDFLEDYERIDSTLKDYAIIFRRRYTGFESISEISKDMRYTRKEIVEILHKMLEEMLEDGLIEKSRKIKFDKEEMKYFKESSLRIQAIIEMKRNIK